jgi:hypothetical protein
MFLPHVGVSKQLTVLLRELLTGMFSLECLRGELLNKETEQCDNNRGGTSGMVKFGI